MIKRFSLALAACALSLSACASIPASPAVVANQTKIDEQVGLTVTLAYTAAARAAGIAINAGLVRDPATIRTIGQLNTRAYAAVLAVHAAYKAGNATGYLSALTQARAAVGDLLAAIKGN